MTKITRQQITELIDRLGGGEIRRDYFCGECHEGGMNCFCGNINKYTTILIGDVLEKVDYKFMAKIDTELPKLARLWMLAAINEEHDKCFTKSSQQIIEDSGWEVRIPAEKGRIRITGTPDEQTLKSPEANALAELLISLFGQSPTS